MELNNMLKNKIIRNLLTVLIFAAIVAGLVARFTLFSMSFEYDELFTAVTTDPSLSLGWIWVNWLVPDVHPPLYNVMMWLYNHCVPFGPELWLRLPSALFGAGAVACGWLMFPRRFGKTARLIFVALLACHQYMILYSQQARAYAWILLLCVPLTFWFLTMSRQIWRRKEITRRQWVQFGLLSLVLAWSHYFGTLLVGIFYGLLWWQAWRYKRPLKMFVLVPVVVGLLFLPWIIPNFLAQVQQHRFTGDNWWANRTVSWYMAGVFLRFFSFSTVGHCALGVLVAGILWVYGRRIKKGLPCAFGREIGLLGAVLILLTAIVGLISLKLYFFIGRYFTVILPALFLLTALLTSPMIRRNNGWRLALLVFLAAEVVSFGMQYKTFHHPTTLPARLTSQFYRDFFRGREMMVAAVEAFPPQSMPAMYGFYVNKVYGLNTRVTELVHLGAPEREAALERHRGAFVFMPNCEEWKLLEISKRWGRKIDVYGNLGTTCLIGFQAAGSYDGTPQQAPSAAK